MRRAPATAMSALTLAVVGLSLRNGPAGHPAAAAPAGVVQQQSASGSTPTRPNATAARRATARTIPTPTAKKPTLTRTATPVTVKPQATASPAPRVAHTAAPVTTTVNGQAVDTRYGPVQVQIQVRAGRINRAAAIDYPQGGGRSQEINRQAVPQLDQETLNAQSAQIDTVSGATYTSDGYRQSLQSALDAAHKAGAL